MILLYRELIKNINGCAIMRTRYYTYSGGQSETLYFSRSNISLYSFADR